MPKLKNPEDLHRLRDTLQNKSHTASHAQPVISIGMGTCGLAAGAGETYQAVQQELEKHNLAADIRSVGCIGICVLEPLVDIQLAGQPRITYANVKPSQVPRLIEEHILRGQVVHEWVVGFVPPDW
jgi:NADH-quinone oxidoreductase subunit F